MIRLAKFTNLTLKRIFVYLTLFFLVVVAIRPQWIVSLEDGFLRLCSQIAPEGIGSLGKSAASPAEIVIVMVDDRSIGEIGNWPWPRNVFSSITERLRSKDVSLIVFEPAIVHDAKIDEMRLPVNREGGTDLIFGYEFYPRLADMPAQVPAGDEAELKRSEGALTLPTSPGDGSAIPAMTGIRINHFSPAERQLVREGFGNIFPDSDGVVRRQPLVARLHERVFPALPVTAAAEWLGFTPIISQDAVGRPTGIVIGDKKISTGHNLELQIGFRGDPKTIPHISVVDILGERIVPEMIEGKMIVIGITSDTIRPPRQTPMGPMYDADITANIITDILRERSFASWTGRAWTIPMFLILGLAFSLVIYRLDTKWQMITTAAIAGFAFLGGLILFILFDIQFPSLELTIASTIFLIAIVFCRVVGVTIPSRALRQKLSWRMRTSDVDRLVEDPSLVVPAGKSVNVTAASLDIKGFSKISATLSAEKLSDFLKEYRSTISQILIDNGAFIDAWSGDECRAVFGAPVAYEGHAIAAVRAGVEIRRNTTAMSDEWKRKFGVEKLRVGIGIQTGAAIVGNIGEMGPTGFGIAGQAVEGARQLRALNRLYRTSTLVGNLTKRATDSEFAYRSLDPVRLSGGEGSSMIHELLGDRGTIMPQLSAFMSARDAYLKGDFEHACQLFEDIMRHYPNDGPTQLLFKRAKAFIDTPPVWRWDGVWKRG